MSYRLTPIEASILRTLLQRQGYYISTNRIANRTRISWITAYTHLKKMWQRGWVNYRKRGSIHYWEARIRF